MNRPITARQRTVWCWFRETAILVPFAVFLDSSDNTSATSGHKKRRTSLSERETKEIPEEQEQAREIHGELAEGNL
ncbi:hypothetical protein Y032_0160g3336 [Ancylostoma ceylanicum]|uniref:Uncharacterized protein n=1 Tax=Ancylostoma ceylanicum TaxID=53326 RepID=A0A016SY64_9BILA|nr:hypothetical protein Y032_0160g3336 [Ancylostoma ceylanicum]